MLKLFTSLALLAAAGLAQAQAGSAALPQAGLQPTVERGSFIAGAQPVRPVLTDDARRQACEQRGESDCARGERKQAGDAADQAPAMKPGPALMWAALGAVAFVALRRRPRP